VFFVVNEKGLAVQTIHAGVCGEKKGLLKKYSRFFFSHHHNRGPLPMPTTLITAIAYLIAILLIQIPILMIRGKSAISHGRD